MSKHNLNRCRSSTRIYIIHKGMKQRCYDKNYRKYKNYGGRGITICDEWLDDFGAFYDWAMNNGYRDDLTIDRIDANGNYEPSNCRWITNVEQQNNKTNNVLLTYNGETKTAMQWSNELNINIHTIYTRHSRKWSDKECLFGRDKKCGIMN